MRHKFPLFTILIFLGCITNTHAQFKSISENRNIKLGGFLCLDGAGFNQDEGLDAQFGPLDNSGGYEVRLAAFHMSGNLYDNIDFKLFTGFYSDKAKVIETYLTLKKLPVIGNFRIGKIREPMRIEALTSRKHLTFLERSLPISFFPIFNEGAMVFNSFFNNRMHVQTSYFKGNSTFDNVVTNESSITSRLTGHIISKPELNHVWHLGVSHRYRTDTEQVYKISSDPEAHLSPVKYLNTGLITDVSHINYFAGETAYNYRNWQLQAEYLSSHLNRNLQEDVQFSSYYAQVSCFVTGEQKRFNKNMYFYGAISPKENFNIEKKQFGAWELALKYSNADLNDKDIQGGEETNITAAVNWYLNPATRIMFDHIWADIADYGKARIFQVRFQVAF